MCELNGQFNDDNEMKKLKMEADELLKILSDLEPKTVEEMILKIIEMADEGFNLTYEENDGEPLKYNDEKSERINVLFSDILNLCSMSIMPMISNIKSLPNI